MTAATTASARTSRFRGQVEHSTEEYGRAEHVNDERADINTNTVEGHYSLFKRGREGTG